MKDCTARKKKIARGKMAMFPFVQILYHIQINYVCGYAIKIYPRSRRIYTNVIVKSINLLH